MKLKPFLALLLATLLAITGCAAALADEPVYTWREHPVKVTGKLKIPMPVPGKDGYTMQLELTVEKSLWKDEPLRAQLIADTLLTDSQGRLYAPVLSGVGEKKPMLTFFFAVPDDVPLEELSLQFATQVGSGSRAATEAASGSTAIALTTAAGVTITLTPLATGAFQAQGDKVPVYTRIGSTSHRGGSEFWAGSRMQLATMRETFQYDKPMVAFAYQCTLDTDKAADAIGVIGEACSLKLDGTTYSPSLAWITAEMACFIFDSPALPEGTPRFSLEGGALVIQP